MIEILNLIAQEVENAARELGYEFSGVKGSKDENETYALGYSKLINSNIRANQQFNVYNDLLKEEIKILKNEINEIRKKL